MSNCPGCDNSSTTYSRCNPPVSSNCTFYQGESLTCNNDATFKVCKGDSLTAVQKTIFEKVCELAGNVNIESIEFPCSLQDAWEDQDPTILNLLKYMVDIQCQQKTLLETLEGSLTTLNPEVEVCLTCCGEDCGPVKLLLSEALTKIVECLCTVKAEAKAAADAADAAMTKANLVYNTIFNPTTGLNALFTDYTKFKLNQQCRVTNLETVVQENISLGNLDGCSSCTTCPTYP